MSYQTRSRAKTVLNTSDELASVGSCCLPDGSSFSGTTYMECIQMNGFFVGGEGVNCPSLGKTGCCCSCSYVDDIDSFVDDPINSTDGLKVTTRCECEENGGVFLEEGNCDQFYDAGDVRQFCTKIVPEGQDYDVRYPAACCHAVIDAEGEVTDIVCEEVCTGQDCIDLKQGDCPPIYHGKDFGGDGRMCNSSHPIFGDPVDCEVEGYDCEAEDDCEDGNTIGSCCAYNISTGIYECDCVTENQCYATWSGNEDYNVCFVVDENGCGAGCEQGVCIAGICASTNCEEDGGTVPIGGEGNFRSANGSPLQNRFPKPRHPLSACCFLNSDGTAYSCADFMSEEDCVQKGGLWAGLDVDKPKYCSSSPCQTPPRKDTSNTINSFTLASASMKTDIDKLEIGDEYKDGIFIGFFEPGPEINGKGSMVRGNQFTGSGQNYESRGFGPGIKRYRRWALLLDNEDYVCEESDTSFLNSSDKIIATSFYDGHYNTHGEGKLFFGLSSSLTEKIQKSYHKNGYFDWYIMSQDELAFVNWTFRNTTLGGILNEGTSLFNQMTGTYLTSTVFSHRDIREPERKDIQKQNINNEKYIYGQEFNTGNDSFVKLIPNNHLTSYGGTRKYNIRLVRKITIE